MEIQRDMGNDMETGATHCSFGVSKVNYLQFYRLYQLSAGQLLLNCRSSGLQVVGWDKGS